MTCTVESTDATVSGGSSPIARGKTATWILDPNNRTDASCSITMADSPSFTVTKADVGKWRLDPNESHRKKQYPVKQGGPLRSIWGEAPYEPNIGPNDDPIYNVKTP